jgi:hypothetical protein
MDPTFPARPGKGAWPQGLIILLMMLTRDLPALTSLVVGWHQLEGWPSRTAGRALPYPAHTCTFQKRMYVSLHALGMLRR